MGDNKVDKEKKGEFLTLPETQNDELLNGFVLPAQL